ncbi:hypothetical protein HYV74_03935 [Candidatus Uhrbacteria bacterium]|nr:hypothetical protein [Candidatus Uhrbacteria bacterium]
MHRTWRIILFFAVLGAMVRPLPGQADVAPAQNPVCWTEKQCAHANLGPLETHWEKAVEGCGGVEWGHCYAGKRVALQIHLATPRGEDVREVSDLRQYIVLAYVWLVRFAAILAVVVIMAGGLMWITSAGAGRIDTAKQWIRNALIGLLLSIGSYVLLQTINPDLVQLSLPRTMMLRPIATGQKFCSSLPREVEIRKFGPNGSIVTDRSQLKCGQIFTVIGASSGQCTGDVCPSGEVCLPIDSSDPNPCKKGAFGGTITNDGDAFIDNNIRLMGVCADGRTWTVDDVDVVDADDRHAKQAYAFAVQSAIQGLGGMPCTVNGKSYNTLSLTERSQAVRGFLLAAEVNDEGGTFGSGSDDFFLVGKKSCSGEARPIESKGGETDFDDFTASDWLAIPAEEFFGVGEVVDALFQKPGAPVVRCDLNVTRANFDDR